MTVGAAPAETARRVLDGEIPALADLLRGIDDRRPEAVAAVRLLHPHSGRAFVVGVTGPPGAGKSTLVDELVARARGKGERVGVLAVDPSSPFTGGAILGDRVRMQRHAIDPGVFIRSVATRGALGGASASTADSLTAIDAAGYGLVLVETAGVGQGEVEVAALADTVVLVLVPGLGDEVQALKAGVLEIADVIAVNKADRDGADRAVADLQGALGLRGAGEAEVALVRTVAVRGTGVDELLDAVEGHRDRQRRTGRWEARRRAQAESRVRAILAERLHAEAEAALAAAGGFERVAAEVASRTLDPYAAADALSPRPPATVVP